MDKRRFHHSTTITVRNYEIDWQGVVHNAVYLHYFDVGRIEYLNHVGATVDINTINHASKVVLARNEIDYLKPARFGEVLRVHSRVALISNTSFVFEGILEVDDSKETVAENRGVIVWLDERTGKPARVPEHFRKLVGAHEGTDCVIQDPTITV